MKYIPREGTVRVRTCVSSGHAELNVVDSGTGMSDQEQSNLFTDHDRTETARKSETPVHEIGLSLTRRIMVAHGGQISVFSRPGTGSAFTIWLALDSARGFDGR